MDEAPLLTGSFSSHFTLWEDVSRAYHLTWAGSAEIPDPDAPACRTPDMRPRPRTTVALQRQPETPGCRASRSKTEEEVRMTKQSTNPHGR